LKALNKTMENPEIPFDLSFVLELAKPPTLEEELKMEKELIVLKKLDDIEAIKNFAEDLARQNHQQSLFIAGCMSKIAELQAKIICMKNPVSQKKDNLLKKILKLF